MMIPTFWTNTQPLRSQRKKTRTLRNFMPGSFQAERFELAKEAIYQHRQNIQPTKIVETPVVAAFQEEKAKNVIKKTAEVIKAKKTQKVAELVTPAKITDYVSSEVKHFQEFTQLGPLRKVAPYAVGIAVGLDVLASREKAAPFGGMAVGGLAWILTRGKVSRGNGLLIGAAGYGVGRIAAGALSAVHSGSLEGLPEQGEAVRGRHRLTQFGSGFTGLSTRFDVFSRTAAASLKKTINVLGDTFPGIRKTLNVNQAIDPLGSTLGKTLGSGSGITSAGNQIEKLTPNSNYVEKWYGIYQESQIRGAAQKAIIDAQKSQGTWESLLPSVKQDPFIYKGVQKKSNQMMEFSVKDVNKALVDYATEKGIKNPPIFWGTQNRTSKMKPMISESAYAERTSRISSISAYPTLAESPRDISGLDTMMHPTLTPEDIRLEGVIGRLSGSGFSVGRANLGQNFKTTTLETSRTVNLSEMKISKTLNVNGRDPVSKREMLQTLNSPVPVYPDPVNPLKGTTIEVAANGTMISGTGRVSTHQLHATAAKMKRMRSDFAESHSNNSLYRRGHPRILEGFRTQNRKATFGSESILGKSASMNMVAANRKERTDFGTGWDPMKKVAQKVLGLDFSKMQAPAVEMYMKSFLKRDDIFSALESGTVLRKLGEGGIGSVEEMETSLFGETFKYARKQAADIKAPDGSILATGKEVLEDEFKGLQALQHSISPTPYRTVTRAVGEDTKHFLYMEGIEDAISGNKAMRIQGGFTQKQMDDLTQGVNELASKGLYHGDLKGGNILIEKEGRLVLFDPFPNRLIYGGWKNVASESEIKAIQLAQDEFSLKRIQQGGNIEDLKTDLGVASNAIVYSAVGQNVAKSLYDVNDWGHVQSYAGAIYRKSKTTHIAEKIGFDPYNVPDMPPIRPGPPIPTEHQAMRRRQLAKVAEQVEQRESLHLKSMQQMQVNNQSSSTRHQSMSQVGGVPGVDIATVRPGRMATSSDMATARPGSVNRNS